MKHKFFLLTMLLALVSITANAGYSFRVANAEGVTIYYTITSAVDKTVEVANGYSEENETRYNNNSYPVSEVIIPSSVTYNGVNYSVTGIGHHAFYRCSSLTSIVMPKSVTYINEGGFGYCTNLTNIVLPSNLTFIDGWAFEVCSSLTNIIIPSGVTSIRQYTFRGCSSLTNIDIPSGVTSIGRYAFSFCSSLTSVDIPASVTSIGNSVFSGCSSLTSVDIPASVTSIGDYAFSYCSRLASVDIPASVTSIGDYAFCSCGSLTSVDIPASVTYIGKSAFANCMKLTSVTSRNPIPPTFSSNSRQLYYFADLSITKCIVKVPLQSLNAYKTAAVWSLFYNIVDIEGTIDAGDNTFNTEIYENTVYRLRTARGYMPNMESSDDYYTYSALSHEDAGQFKIIGANESCHIYNVNTSMYLSAEAGRPYYVEEANGTFSLIPATTLGGLEGHWIIKSNVTGKWIMFGGSQQYLNNDGWTTVDAGDQWIFEDVEMEDAGIETDVVGLDASESIQTVLVNGQVVLCGTKAGERIQLVTVDGVELCSVLAQEGATTLPCRLAKGTMVLVKCGGKTIKQLL